MVWKTIDNVSILSLDELIQQLETELAQEKRLFKELRKSPVVNIQSVYDCQDTIAALELELSSLQD